jgi:hypothetical protein
VRRGRGGSTSPPHAKVLALHLEGQFGGAADIIAPAIVVTNLIHALPNRVAVRADITDSR